MISETEFTISILLLILIVFVLFYCVSIFFKQGSQFRLLLLLNYIVTQPVSGIAHLSQWGTSRGYFDILNFPSSHLSDSVSATLLGALTLVLGMGFKVAERVNPPAAEKLTNYESRILFALIVLLGPAALYGLVQMNSIAASLGTARIIELEGGTARFSFLSHWFAFVSTFAAVLFVNRYGTRQPLVVLVALSASFLAILLALTWSGGRSIVIVMALPLLFYAIPKLKAFRWPAILIGGTAFLIYVIIVSQTRSDRLTAGAGVNVGNWLDWEWGRFSMSGLAVESSARNGLLSGETFLSAVRFTLQPALGFLGLTFPYLRTPMDVASRITLGDFTLLYMVPGYTAELLMNFGLTGVAIGYFVLGRATRWLDFGIEKSNLLLVKLLLFYIGGLLVFRVLPSGSVAFLVYLTYSGTPLLLAAMLLNMRSWLTAVYRSQVQANA